MNNCVRLKKKELANHPVYTILRLDIKCKPTSGTYLYVMYKYSFTLDAFPPRAAVITRTLTYISYSRCERLVIHSLYMPRPRQFIRRFPSSTIIFSSAEFLFVWLCVISVVFFSPRKSAWTPSKWTLTACWSLWAWAVTNLRAACFSASW